MRKLLAAMFVLALAPAAFAEEAPTGTTPTPTDPAPAAVAPAPAATATAPATSNAAPAATAPGATLTANAAAVQRPGGFHMGLSVDHSVGSGTFTKTNEGGIYSLVTGALVVAPAYSFEVQDVKLAAHANAAFAYEYTTPDNPTGRHYDWGDIGVGLSAPAIYKEKITGITISPRIGVTLPVSLASHFRGTITNLSGGISLGRGFGKFSVGASVGASKTFYASVTRNISEDETKQRDPQGNVIFTCRTDSDNCGLRGVPTLWAISGGLNASYSPIDRLSIALGFNMSKALKYYIGRDEYSSQKFDSNGNPVVKEQGTMDNMVGSVSVGYQLTDNISASLAMATAQAPLNSRNDGIRFPFFAFDSLENSATQYSLAISAEF